jgi:hypothetical protein
MCMQCMATAAASVGVASGMRAWMASRLRPTAAKIGGFAVMTLAVIVAGVSLSASG